MLRTVIASVMAVAALVSCNDDGAVVAPATTAAAAAGGRAPEATGHPDCLYRRDVVLVRGTAPTTLPADLAPLDPAELAEMLGLDDSDAASLDEMLATEVITAFEVLNDADPLQLAVDLEASEGVQASPVLLATVAGHWSFAPGAPPNDRVEAPFTPPAAFDPNATVAVVDTGYSETLNGSDPTPEWLAERVEPASGARDEEPSHTPPLVAGHGKFVASIIAQEAPHAAVRVAGMSNVESDTFFGEELPPAIDDGFVSDEFQLYLGVARLLAAREPYAALNLSVGSYACPGLDKVSGGGGTDALESGFAVQAAVNAWNKAFSESDVHPPIVAAAGNHDPAEPEPGIPFLPAAYASDPSLNVFAIASTDDVGGRLSDFSNSADVTAVGRNLIGVRVDGELASWSGSSFATAVASGAVAAGRPFSAPAALPLVGTTQG